MRCSDCHGVIFPVVALDIDGTMAQYHRALIAFIERWLGRRLPPTAHMYDGKGEFSDAMELDKKTYQEAKLAFRAGGFKRWMDPFPYLRGLLDVINSLNCELWVTTTRPWMRMDNVDPDTREWLRRNGVDFSGLLYDEDKYGELIHRVDPERIVFILEDQWDMYDRADGLGLPIHLISTHFNRAIQRERMSSNLADAARQVAAATTAWRQQHG